MTILRSLLPVALALCAVPLAAAKKPNPKPEPTPMPQGLHAFSVADINGKPSDLSQYRGKVLLVVNVASECGFTYQYKGLEELHRKYRDQSFLVLGFPSNDFGHQEPGTEAEIKDFCERNYQVSFPLFAKSHAKGDEISPLFHYLTSQPGHEGNVAWNFNKFLIGKDGNLITRWASGTKPMDKEVTEAVEKALAH